MLKKGKEEDGESIEPEESHSPVDGIRAKDAGEGVCDPTESFHPQDLNSKESDKEVRDYVKSLKEMDVEAEDGSTGQAVVQTEQRGSSSLHRSWKRGWSWMTRIWLW